MWCWSKRRRLEKNRTHTLSTIAGERSLFEPMLQRAQITGMAISTFPEATLSRLAMYEAQAKVATTKIELEGLEGDAEEQGQLRAYLCPNSEVAAEGVLNIDLMEEWGVPPEQTNSLRKRIEPALTGTDYDTARGALRKIFEESDSWSDYVDDHYRTMRSATILLLGAIVLLSASAIVLFHWPSGVLFGFLLAGAAGGCASVIVWAPRPLVTPSKELDAYKQRIFGRVGIAIVTGLIGTALLGWGWVPLSVRGDTFSDVLNACTAVPPTSCSHLRILILLGVSMIFGFSERALSRFEEKFVR